MGVFGNGYILNNRDEFSLDSQLVKEIDEFSKLMDAIDIVTENSIILINEAEAKKSLWEKIKELWHKFTEAVKGLWNKIFHRKKANADKHKELMDNIEKSEDIVEEETITILDTATYESINKALEAITSSMGDILIGNKLSKMELTDDIANAGEKADEAYNNLKQKNTIKFNTIDRTFTNVSKKLIVENIENNYNIAKDYEDKVLDLYHKFNGISFGIAEVVSHLKNDSNKDLRNIALTRAYSKELTRARGIQGFILKIYEQIMRVEVNLNAKLTKYSAFIEENK